MKRIILGIILTLLYITRLVWAGHNGVQYEAVVVFGLLGWMMWSGVNATKKSKQRAENAVHNRGEIK